MLAKATPKNTCIHKLFKILLVCKYKNTDLSLTFVNSLYYFIKISDMNDVYDIFSAIIV